MKHIAPILAPFIMVFTLVAHAEQLNVSYNQPVSIFYTGQPPADSNRANARFLVDGNSFTFVTIAPKNSGSDNTGTFITVSLGNTFPLTRYKIKQPFEQEYPLLRVRGYQIQTSQDSVVWTNVVDVANNSAPSPDTTLSSSVNASYVRLVITKIDEGNTNLTAISEFEIYADLDYPAVKSIGLTASPAGSGYREIVWSTMNMKTTDSVNVYYEPPGATTFLPLGLNEPNDGTFKWQTGIIYDGVYLLKIAPVASGKTLPMVRSFGFSNFSGLSIADMLPYLLVISSVSQVPYPPPPYYSSILGDTIHFSWKYQSEYQLPFNIRLSYSIDDRKTWTPFATLPNSAASVFDWKMTNPISSGAFGYFQVSIVQNNVAVLSANTKFPVALSSSPPGVSLLWSRNEAAVRSIPRTIPSLLSFSQGSKEAILLDKNWAVFGNGDTVPSMGTIGPSAGVMAMAAGSFSGIGSTSFAYGNSSDESPQFSDVDKDGKDELFWGSTSVITCNRSDGSIFDYYYTPSATGVHCAVADVDIDNEKEVIFTDPYAAQVAVVTPHASAKKGFPVKLVDQPQSWTLVADLDGSGNRNIITSSPTHLFVLNSDGSMRKGFPLRFNEPIWNRCPAIADINNDGRLDIVLLTSDKQRSVTKIYVINDSGSVLLNWPVNVAQSFSYPGKLIDAMYPGDTLQTTYNIGGTPASPLVVSLDGGRSVSIVLGYSTGFLYAFDSNGTTRNGFPMYVACHAGEAGVFGDFDGNGTLNYVFHSFPRLDKPGKVLCLDFGPGSYSSNHLPWPMHLQNARRTGIAPKPHPLAVHNETRAIPDGFALAQNYPNPFNSSTIIQYAIARSGHVRLRIYDLLGRSVATLVDDVRGPGFYSARFDASHFSSGVYIYRLEADASTSAKKLIVQK